MNVSVRRLRQVALGVAAVAVILPLAACDPTDTTASGNTTTSATTTPSTTDQATTAQSTAPTTQPGDGVPQTPARVHTTQPGTNPTSAPAGQQPTLGVPWNPQIQQGYGQVRPATINNGGDPTGILDNVTWSSWGGATATGTGTGVWVGPNQVVAQGTPARATVVAFNLGPCEGRVRYRSIEWYFPEHGESFNPANAQNICTTQD